MFFDNGMFLQMKIIPTIWPLQNMIIRRVIDGFFFKTSSNTVLAEHRSDFKQALSTLQQLKQK